jgi:hypothetical protein
MRRLARSAPLALLIRCRGFVSAVAAIAASIPESPPAAAAPKPRLSSSSRWQGLSPLGVPSVRRPSLLPEPPRRPLPPPDQSDSTPPPDPNAASAPVDPAPEWAPPPPPPPPRNPARSYEAGLRSVDGPAPLSLEAIGRMVGDPDGGDGAGTDGAGAPPSQGLSLRLLAGPAHLSIKARSTEGPDSSQLAGWGLGLAATAGGWIAPGIALGATLAATSVLDPAITGSAIVQPIGPATLTTFAVGLDLVYQVDPIASTVSLGALLEQLRLVDQSTSYVHSGTRLGPGLGAGLDKQWNVGGLWWMGASARGSIAWGQDLRRQMRVTAVSLCFGLSLGYD